jgi:hypothetical protein
VDGVSCGKSGIYTGITYAGIGNNLAISTVNGTHQISLVRFIKGSDTYKSNFVLPTEPFKYVPKTNWTVNGNAKISTNQKFDGFSSLYAYDKVYTNSTINLENLDFTISFNFLFDAFGSIFNAIFTSKTGSATENILAASGTKEKIHKATAMPTALFTPIPTISTFIANPTSW